MHGDERRGREIYKGSNDADEIVDWAKGEVFGSVSYVDSDAKTKKLHHGLWILYLYSSSSCHLNLFFLLLTNEKKHFSAVPMTRNVLLLLNRAIKYKRKWAHKTSPPPTSIAAISLVFPFFLFIQIEQ